jgi:hypothetical protein
MSKMKKAQPKVQTKSAPHRVSATAQVMNRPRKIIVDPIVDGGLNPEFIEYAKRVAIHFVMCLPEFMRHVGSYFQHAFLKGAAARLNDFARYDGR